MSDNVMCFIAGAMLMYLIMWLRYAWVHRRQPARLDAPTGREPWIRPQPRVRR